jgi:hypothetical protein
LPGLSQGIRARCIQRSPRGPARSSRAPSVRRPHIRSSIQYYHDGSTNQIATWNIQANGSIAVIGFQTGTTFEPALGNIKGYVFFNDEPSFDGNANITLDTGGGSDAIFLGHSNISIGAFQPNIYSSVLVGVCRCNLSFRHSRLRRYNPLQRSASRRPALVWQWRVGTGGRCMAAQGEGFPLAGARFHPHCPLFGLPAGLGQPV